MIYYFTYFFTKFLSFVYFPRTITGHEHIPPQGGFIIASNHVSNLDPVVMGVSSLRRIKFMAKFELFQKQPLGYFLTKLGAFPIKRGEADLGALKNGIQLLKAGWPLLVFIEGTRRIGDAPSSAQAGAALMAVKAKVPVIPVYINGTQDAMPPGATFFTRKPVTVVFGPAVQYNPKDSYQAIADHILRDIYRLKK